MQGTVVVVIVWYLDLQLPMQSVPITNNVVSSKLTHGEVYSITTLCDKVCQWLTASQWFSPSTLVSSANKTDSHDITEILLKLALNSITPCHASQNIPYIGFFFACG